MDAQRASNGELDAAVAVLVCEGSIVRVLRLIADVVADDLSAWFEFERMFNRLGYVFISPATAKLLDRIEYTPWLATDRDYGDALYACAAAFGDVPLRVPAGDAPGFAAMMAQERCRCRGHGGAGSI